MSRILTLAEWYARERPPLRRLRVRVRRLARERPRGEILEEAMASVGACAVPGGEGLLALSLVGREAIAACCDPDLLLQFHRGWIEHMLGADPEDSLRPLVWHTRRALELYPAGSQEYFETLRMNAVCHEHLMKRGVDPVANGRRAVAGLARVRRHRRAAPGGHYRADYVSICADEGCARLGLAEAGHKPGENFRRSSILYRIARQLHRPFSPGWLGLQADEARARLQLADHVEHPELQLRQAARLARRVWRGDPGTRSGDVALVIEAEARERLADRGFETIENLEVARRLYDRAAGRRAWSGEKAVDNLLKRVKCRAVLASHGVRPQGYVEEALRLCREARELGVPRARLAGIVSAEGGLYKQLAEHGIDPLENLRRAIELQAEAGDYSALEGWERQDTRAGHAWLGSYQDRRGRGGNGDEIIALINEANCRQRLAEYGFDTRRNLQEAIRLNQLFRRRVEPGDRNLGGSQVAEANAWVLLAHDNYYPRSSAERAVALCRDAAARLAFYGGRDLGDALFAEAGAHLCLAELGFDSARELGLAVGLLRQARQHFPAGTRWYAWALINEANALMDLAAQRVDGAEESLRAFELFEEALDVFREEDFERARVLLGLGRALEHACRHREAIGAYDAGLGMIERIRSRILSPRDRANFLDRVQFAHGGTLRCSLHLARSAEDGADRQGWHLRAWHAAHRAKSRSLLELVVGATAWVREEDHASWEACEQAGRGLDALERSGLDPDESAELRKAQDTYRRARHQLLHRVERSLDLRALDVPGPIQTLEALGRLAGRGTRPEGRPLLVEYYRTDKDELAAFLVPLWLEGVVEVERIRVPSRSIAAVAEELRTFSQGGAAAGAERVTGILDRVGELFVQPLAGALDALAPSELVLSPHSLLHLLPIHAGTYRGRPLIAHLPVSYLPSPALASELALRRVKPQPGSTALVIADPTGDLSGAAREGEVVARLLTSSGLKPAHLRREDATSARVASELPRAGVIHFSGHTRFEETDFLRSGLELRDRRLTALELLGAVRTPDAGLVYLSSCESGAVVVDQPDELQALARVFLAAGSPSVVASLWPLDEAVSAQIAAAFYRTWLGDGVALNVAIRRAILRAREEFPNPLYWAPIVLVGAWA